jgi:predicted transcriptional regulator
MPTKVFTAHIPLELAEKVDALAGRLERPRGWVVKQALQAWIADEEERDRLTREALREVEQGLTVDHARVLEWVDSLGGPNPIEPPKP